MSNLSIYSHTEQEFRKQIRTLTQQNDALREAGKYVIERAEIIASWGGQIDCKHVIDELDLANLRAALTPEQVKP